MIPDAFPLVLGALALIFGSFSQAAQPLSPSLASLVDTERAWREAGARSDAIAAELKSAEDTILVLRERSDSTRESRAAAGGEIQVTEQRLTQVRLDRSAVVIRCGDRDGSAKAERLRRSGEGQDRCRPAQTSELRRGPVYLAFRRDSGVAARRGLSR